MTPIEFWFMFVVGVVGSIHCVQMCGPIVLSYSLPLAGRGPCRRELALAHLWYNLGRITTYTVLGALAGAAGGVLGLAGRLAGIAHAGRMIAGVAMIAAGVYIAGLVRRKGPIKVESPGLAARLARTGKHLMLSSRPRNKFSLGLVLGFLPCGLVYAALLKAVGAGGAVSGALTMSAFGLGTSMALAATGLVSTAFGWRLGRWSRVLAGAGIILLGAWLIWMGLAPAGAAMQCHQHVRS